MADNPTIVLIPHSRSHPFTQRECSCLEPLKVGRSVDKKRIFPNNLIFDCRVLSRNHALIWYENGKVRHITDEASIRKPAHERDFKRHSLHPLHSHSIPTHTKHWYALLTQFYIQDTKSSNGTFVNETRLSPSGEESAPVELKSRDVVQFGVNVNVEKRGRFIRAPRKRRLRGVFKLHSAANVRDISGKLIILV